MISLRFLLLFLSTFIFASNSYSRSTEVGVVVETVRISTISNVIEALGTTKANETVNITASVSEIVKQVQFRSAQRVKKGDVLLELESSEERALLTELEHTLNEAKSQLQRIQSLAKRGDASQSLLDEKQREYNVAHARLTAIQSRLEDRIIRAPFSGLVGLRNVSPGAFLAPGEIITTLIDDSQIKLDFNVASIHLTSLTPDMDINAKAKALGNQVFTGTVSSMNNYIDPVSRSITVRALLPNPNHLLKPGLLMEVELQANQRESILISEGALVQQGNTKFLYVISHHDGNLIAKKTNVLTGLRKNGKIEILEGIKAGDQIIVHGAMKIKDGSQVLLLTSPTKAVSE